MTIHPFFEAAEPILVLTGCAVAAVCIGAMWLAGVWK